MHRAEKASSKLCREREVEKAQALHRRKIGGVKSYLSAIITRPTVLTHQPSGLLPVEPPTTQSNKSLFRRSHHHHKQQHKAVKPPAAAQAQHTGRHGNRNSSRSGSSGQDEDESAEELEQDDENGDDWSASGGSDGDSDQANASSTVVSQSFGKLDELRSVLVPVMAYNGGGLHAAGKEDLQYERLLDQITRPQQHQETVEPPAPSPPLRASAFRMRRLKQIEVDNVTLFGRIKNTTAHYKTQHFHKEWTQNVAYLTSICEFPVLDEMLHHPSPPPLVVGGSVTGIDTGTATAGAYRRRRPSPFTARSPDHLPRLEHTTLAMPVAHPIKAIPTSPRKIPQLNLSPAFRSLRKGLPQVPTLPPLTTSPRMVVALTNANTKTKSTTAIVGSRPPGHVDLDAEEEGAVGLRSVACFSQRDLISSVQHQQQQERQSSSSSWLFPEHQPNQPLIAPERTAGEAAEAGDSLSRYTLLKMGRFIGGKYLVLTVFCGHSITNPYGFDVVALDPERHVEFHLSITKTTTHCLLDTISSSSMAQKTAAAAGTNLSMEMIASCICDHVRYASLGACELVFLVASVGTRGGLRGETAVITWPEQQSPPSTSSHSVSDDHHAACYLLLDTAYSAMALCFHQDIRIPCDDDGDGDGDRYGQVFARTRPQQSCQARMNDDATTPRFQAAAAEYGGSGRVGGGGGGDTESMGLVCYEVWMDNDQQSGGRRCYTLQLSVSELLRLLSETTDRQAIQDPHVRLSLDCLVMVSLRYLHVIHHHDGAGPTDQLVLLPSARNKWICGPAATTAASSSPRRPLAMMALPPSPVGSTRCSRHYRHHGNQHLDDPTTIKPARSPVKPSHLADDEQVKCVLQTGMLWRDAYLFIRVALLCPTRQDPVSGQVIRDPMEELLVVNVLNTSTGCYSERILDGDQVEELSNQLGAWQTPPQPTDDGAATSSSNCSSSLAPPPPPLVVFSKLLLRRLRLDVDLHNNEMIVFPSLEHHSIHTSRARQSPVGRAHPPSRRRPPPPKKTLPAKFAVMEKASEQAALVIQALGRGYLTRWKLTKNLHQSNVVQQAQAASKIQSVCRQFVRRKHAHASVDGVVRAPLVRVPTPTVPGRRALGQEQQQQQPVAVHEQDDGDEEEGGRQDTEQCNDQADDLHGEDDEDEDEEAEGCRGGWTKHVDLLGRVDEDGHEEDHGAAAAAVGSTRISQVLSLPQLQLEPPSQSQSKTCRSGHKENDGCFVLLRQAVFTDVERYVVEPLGGDITGR